MMPILAALSATAATGMRIALPLLAIGLLQGENFWYNVPILSGIYPPVVLAILVSLSLIELIASKQLLGQRLLQIVYLIFSPIVGAIIAIATADTATVLFKALIGLIGGLLALLLQLVQAGWLYRWRRLPVWLPFVQDGLCVLLIYLAVQLPLAGGIIAFILLGLAIYSSQKLHRWYLSQYQSKNHE